MSLEFLEGSDPEGEPDFLDCGPSYLRVTGERGVLCIYADMPGKLFPVIKANEQIYNQMREKLNSERRAKLDAALKSCQEFLGRMKTIGTDANAYTEMEILWSVEF